MVKRLLNMRHDTWYNNTLGNDIQQYVLNYNIAKHLNSYSECRYIDCHSNVKCNAKCHCTECRYSECCGTIKCTIEKNSNMKWYGLMLMSRKFFKYKKFSCPIFRTSSGLTWKYYTRKKKISSDQRSSLSYCSSDDINNIVQNCEPNSDSIVKNKHL